MLSRILYCCKNSAVKVPSLCRAIRWNLEAADNMVDITFSFADGQSRSVKARIGDTLKETAESYQLPIPGDCHGLGLPKKVFHMEKWTADTYEKRDQCQFCHIIVSDAIMEQIPKPAVGEQMWLDKIARNRNKNSRLACQIKVTEGFDGATIFVPNEEKM